MSLLDDVQRENLRTDLPEFRPGDKIRVFERVIEGEKERVQIFEGIVIRKRGEMLSATFTVRKKSLGVGVEKIYPLHSPKIQKVEVIRRGNVRRANLGYLRGMKDKAIRDKLK